MSITDAEVALWNMTANLDELIRTGSPEADDLRRCIAMLRSLIIEARTQAKTEINLPSELRC